MVGNTMRIYYFSSFKQKDICRSTEMIGRERKEAHWWIECSKQNSCSSNSLWNSQPKFKFRLMWLIAKFGFCPKYIYLKYWRANKLNINWLIWLKFVNHKVERALNITSFVTFVANIQYPLPIAYHSKPCDVYTK